MEDGRLLREIGNFVQPDVIQCESLYGWLKPGEEFDEVVRCKLNIIELQVGYIELEKEISNVGWDAWPRY